MNIPACRVRAGRSEVPPRRVRVRKGGWQPAECARRRRGGASGRDAGFVRASAAGAQMTTRSDQPLLVVVVVVVAGARDAAPKSVPAAMNVCKLPVGICV